MFTLTLTLFLKGEGITREGRELADEEKKDWEDVNRLLKQLKSNVAKKLLAGETGLTAELERINDLELKLAKQKDKGKDEALQQNDHKEEYGIPERLKVKRRKYTLSEEAIAQRRGNVRKISEGGLQTGPTTEEGKKTVSKNSWKHGIYAQTFFRKYSKPCKSSCSSYPCQLISDGKTTPGGECLDKEHVYESWNAIMDAVFNNNYEGFNALAALDTAKNMQILRDLQDGILEDGSIVKSEKIDKDGNVIGHEIKPHPALLVLPKLAELLGFTPKDLMITPKELAKAGRDDEGIKSIADLMSAVGKAMKKDK